MEYMKGYGLLKEQLSIGGFIQSYACFRSVLAVKSQRSRSRIRKVNKEIQVKHRGSVMCVSDSVHGFGAVMLLFGRHPLAVCMFLCGQ